MWLDQNLKNFGLKSSVMDPCIAYIYHGNDLNLIIAIYVDDFLKFHNTEAEETLNNMKKLLVKKFRMKYIGLAKGCLGNGYPYTPNSKRNWNRSIFKLLIKISGERW